MKKFFITQVVQAIVLVFFYYFLGFDQWLGNKFRDLVITVSVYLLVGLIGGISFFFRPLFMKIALSNKRTEDKSTVIDIEDEELKTPQHRRTISISVSIERRGRIWWRLMKWVLKHNDVYVCVQAAPSDIYVQANDDVLINEIEMNEDKGFDLFIRDIFVQLSRRKKDFSIMKKYEFFVLNHSEITLPPASTYTIEPIIQIKKNSGRSPQWLYHFVCNRLLKYETETHEVKVFRG